MYVKTWSSWTLTHFGLVCKIIRHIVKQFGNFFERLYMHLPYDPGIILLGIYLREMKVCVHTKTCMRMFKVALFIIAVNWQQPKCPLAGKWINKLWYIHVIKYSQWYKRTNYWYISNIDMCQNMMLNERRYSQKVH